MYQNDYYPDDSDRGDEDIQVLSDKTVKTRKVHICDGCKGPIATGTMAVKVALIGANGFEAFYTHPGQCPLPPHRLAEAPRGADEYPF